MTQSDAIHEYVEQARIFYKSIPNPPMDNMEALAHLYDLLLNKHGMSESEIYELDKRAKH